MYHYILCNLRWIDHMDTCTGICHHDDVIYLYLTVHKNILKEYSVSANTSHTATLFKHLDNFPSQTIEGYLQNRICFHKWKPLDILSLISWTYCQQYPPLALMATFWENWLSPKHAVIPMKENNHNIVKTLYSFF